MKKLTFILSALFVLLVVSCTNELENTMQEGKLSFSSISASMGDLPTARVHLESDGKVVWDVDDQIGIYSDTQTTPTKFTCTNVSESSATFSSDDEVSGSNFFAYYPYENTTIVDNTMKCTLPSYYIEHTTSTFIKNSPMIAQSNTNEFNFKHTCGFIRFSITGTHIITKLVLQGNNYEKICGTGIADLDKNNPTISIQDGYSSITMFVGELQLSSSQATDFYFIVPVVEFTKGISLAITYKNEDSTETTIKKTTLKPVNISRSVIKSFSVFDTDDLIEEIANEEERIYGALMAFYNATGGNGWVHKDNWGTQEPYTEWYGLNTTNFDNEIKITGISLNENGLKGSIPKEITNLKYLNSLYLANNEIDSIPSFLGELSFLEEISMGNCKLSGRIPEKLSLLRNLKVLNMPHNNLEVTNLEFLGNLSPTLQFIDMQDNNISGTLPSGLGNLINLYWLNLNKNNITGNIPENIFNLSKLSLLDLGNNQLSGTISSSIKKLSNIQKLNLLGNELTGEIPKELGDLVSLTVLQLGENQLSGNIPEEITKLTNLETLGIFSNQLSGMLPEKIVQLQNLKNLFLADNKLNGTCSETLSEFIEDLNYTIEQQAGYELKLYFYESSKFVEDGKVETLWTHTKGNGINIIITIDAFTDKDVEENVAQSSIQKAFTALFEEEPYKSFKEYFDVYSVLSISKRRKIGTETALGTTYYNGSNNIFKFSLDYDQVEMYAKKVPAISSGIPNNTHILVVLNDKTSYRAYCTHMAYGSVSCANMISDDQMKQTIKHEMCGHGIAKLGDEYTEEGNDAYVGAYPDDAKNSIWESHMRGEYLNVDVTNDTNQIVWKEFLNNEDYAESVAIYEGALLYAKGAYRPTEQSIMRHNVGGFNAPSRWAIYKHILEAAGETPTFEAFLEYDKKNLNTTSAVSARSVSEEPFDTRKLGAPPVFLNR